jgi:hypothetical protein
MLPYLSKQKHPSHWDPIEKTYHLMLTENGKEKEKQEKENCMLHAVGPLKLIRSCLVIANRTCC